VDLRIRLLELQIHEEAMSAKALGTTSEPGDRKKQPMTFELREGPDDEVQDLMSLAVERPQRFCKALRAAWLTPPKTATWRRLAVSDAAVAAGRPKNPPVLPEYAPDPAAANRRIVPDVVVEARKYSALAIDTLVELFKDNYPGSTRYNAATALLDRGYGHRHLHVGRGPQAEGVAVAVLPGDLVGQRLGGEKEDLLLAGERHLDTLLDFVGFVTANCVQHYEEGLKPEAVAKLHFSETEIAAYCVCSTKLLVGEMDERDLKTLEAGKVGNVLMSLAPALKRIRYGCARKVWDARRKQ
jgi:hypothetical protein